MADYVLNGYYPPMGVYSKDDVKQVQQQLNASGANLKVDGIWGPATNAAYYAGETLNSGGNSFASAFGGLNLNPAPYNVGSAYDAAGQYYKQAVDAAYASNKANLDAQASALSDQYDAVRNQAYVNARLNAIGNNEILASQGLAGNIYDNPVSGVSETSRTAQNIGMRNDINAATRQENAERDAIALEIIRSGYTRDAEYAKWMADMQIAKANAEMQAAQQAFENSLKVASLMSDMYGSGGGYGSSGGGYSGGRSSGGSAYNETAETARVKALENANKTTTNDKKVMYEAGETYLNGLLSSGQISPTEYNKARASFDSAIEYASPYNGIYVPGWI